MATISKLELEKALNSLKDAIHFFQKQKNDLEIKIARDAIIQRFEFSVELSWKVSAKIMGTLSTAPRTIVREMAQNNLIDSPEVWFNYLDSRNKSSHSYDEKIAIEVYNVALKFLPDGFDLLEKLDKL